MRRDQLPGDFARSKKGHVAYLVTTNLRNRAGEPVVRLRSLLTEITGSGLYSIEDLVRYGCTFSTDAPRGMKRAAARAGTAQATTRCGSGRRGALPPLGTVLEARYKDVAYQAEITADGVVWNDKAYPSLSAAGRAVTGRPTCAGPRFWTEGK